MAALALVAACLPAWHAPNVPRSVAPHAPRVSQPIVLPHALVLPAGLRAASTASTPLRLSAETDAAPEQPPWYKRMFAFDKSKLASLGVDAFLTYGVASNINAGLLVSFAWYVFSKTSGLSPIVTGQWPKFLVQYAALYATLGTLLRPFRLAFAISMTPVYSRVVRWVQSWTPFANERPRLNRTIAVVTLSLTFNLIGTCSLIVFGVWLAGVLAGVPAVPVGYKFIGYKFPFYGLP